MFGSQKETKPKENKSLEAKKQRNLRKTNIFAETNNETLRKQICVQNNTTKPEENQYFGRENNEI